MRGHFGTLRAMGACDRGIAAVEFALIAPLLLLLYLGASDLSFVVTADRKLQLLADTSASLVAQLENKTSGSEIDDVFTTAAITLEPIRGQNLSGSLTAVRISNAKTAVVVWSRSWNGAPVPAKGSSINLPAGLLSAGNPAYIIASVSQDWRSTTMLSELLTFRMNKTGYAVPYYTTEAIPCDGC